MLRLVDKYGLIIDNVLNKFINSTRFGYDTESDYCSEVEMISDYVYHKPAEAEVVGSMWVSTGATKMVIGFDDLDCVLKVPFQGSWWDEYDDNNEVCESHFSQFCYGDYCSYEEEIYFHAKEFGVAELFAKMECVATLKCGIPVYKQPKVRAFGDWGGSRTPSKDSVKRAEQRRYDSPFCTSWTALVIDIYGEEFFDKLLTFITDICPETGSDWHQGNYGYTEDGLPVIIDYAGYYE